ncbi:MAG: hypothetical protein ACYDDF_08925 [Thermoplasmatota archaeon]
MGTWTFRAAYGRRGFDGGSLMCWPPERWLYSEAEVLKARNLRRREAAAVMKAFAKEYGMSIGDVIPMGRTDPLGGVRLEFGLPAPGVPKFGDPNGNDEFYADTSPGADRRGEGEIETTREQAAAAWVRLPLTIEELKNADVAICVTLARAIQTEGEKTREVLGQLLDALLEGQGESSRPVGLGQGAPRNTGPDGFAASDEPILKLAGLASPPQSDPPGMNHLLDPGGRR